MSRPIYVTKAAPPAMAGPHDPDDDEGPKDWEIAWENAQHGHEPDSMSMEGLGGEEVIPYLSEEELHNGANKWNHINPDSPNPYRMELNKRTLDSQHGIMLPETADAQDYKNEMGHREKDGELGEWERAARADEPAPKGAEYQHHLRSAPDLDLQAEMYAQMMQNDPLNPTFTAGDPMNLAFRLLKDLSAEDLEQASRTGGLLRLPNTVGGLVGGQDQPLTQGMARQLYAGQQGEIGDVHAGHDILSDPREHYHEDVEGNRSTLFSESGKSRPWRRHPGFDESSEGQDMSMGDPRLWEGPTPHPSEGSKLDGQTLAMLHQRQEHEMSEQGQREEQEEIERQASMERQMQQRMAEVSAAPSAAPPAREWDNSMPEPMSTPHAAAMQKLAQRQAANNARLQAQKNALNSRSRKKFSRR